MPVFFHSEKIKFRIKNKATVARWLLHAAQKENAGIDTLHYIFCSDNLLHSLNKKFLRHDTLTDIITFPYSQNRKKISADIFISIQRVKENAKKFETDFETELKRVIIHGLLHLVGYSDKKQKDKKIMRGKENGYLLEYLRLK